MILKRNLIIIAALVLLLPAGARGNGTGFDDYLNKNVITKRLPNGITLVMLDRGFSPTLAFEISFRVGSADESYRYIGAAHMLEHMLFKGTDTVGTRDYEKEKKILREIEAVGETLDRIRLENPDNTMIPKLEKRLKELQEEHSRYVVNAPYDRIYTENGGVGFNAGTSRDKTGYYIELPSSRLELWAKVESERLRNPVLREYYLERNNVIQERLMRYESSGTGGLFERFLATAYLAHPYRHPIIGWKSGIPYLSIKDIRHFYWKNYIPSRMVITIVGKQDVEETYRVVKEYFGAIKSRPEPREIAIDEPAPGGERRFTYRFKANPYLIIGWHKPTFPDRDDYICDVISSLLGDGKSSRLYRSLVLEKKLVSSIDVWNGFPGARYDNLFIVFAAPRPGHSHREVERAVYREIEKLKQEVSAEELEKVVNKLESELVFRLDSNMGMANLLNYYQTIFGDWKYITDYLRIIREVNPEDVKSAIDRYLVQDNRVVGMLQDSRKGKGK